LWGKATFSHRKKTESRQSEDTVIHAGGFGNERNIANLKLSTPWETRRRVRIRITAKSKGTLIWSRVARDEEHKVKPTTGKDRNEANDG